MATFCKTIEQNLNYEAFPLPQLSSRFLCTYNPFSPAPTPFNCWQPLNLFSTIVIILFHECCIHGITKHITLGDWLFSLNNSQHIHPGCWVCQLFVFSLLLVVSSISWHARTTVYVTIPWRRTSGHFRFLTIMNKIAINIGVQFFCVNTHFHFSGIHAQGCNCWMARWWHVSFF